MSVFKELLSMDDLTTFKAYIKRFREIFPELSNINKNSDLISIAPGMIGLNHFYSSMAQSFMERLDNTNKNYENGKVLLINYFSIVLNLEDSIHDPKDLDTAKWSSELLVLLKKDDFNF